MKYQKITDFINPMSIKSYEQFKVGDEVIMYSRKSLVGVFADNFPAKIEKINEDNTLLLRSLTQPFTSETLNFVPINWVRKYN